MEQNELENIFTYHPVKEGQDEKYKALRARGLEMAQLIFELCPSSRERSVAITKLQEVIMFSNASIAIHE